METSDRPVIFIVGQTASGKTALAIEIAKKYKAEIICADSRTIYKHMDKGTAKPSIEECSGVPHYGLDLITPDQFYSAAEFKEYAKQKINEIHSRVGIPIVVGGTGLYIDGVLYDYLFSKPNDKKTRESLTALSLDELQSKAKQLGITEEDVNFKNHRHLSNAVARGGVIKQSKNKKDNYLVLGIKVDKEVLDKRIENRAIKIINNGLEKEVKELLNSYGPDAPGLNAPAYKAFIKYSQNKISYSEAEQEFIKQDKRLSKRQKTWFKRNKDIIWINNLTEAVSEVENFLSKFDTIHT